MGQNEINSKLKTVLEQDLFDEPNVVYILSRVRKLLDLGIGKKKDFKTLHFYCTWVLHNRLDRKQTTEFLTEKFSISPNNKLNAKQIADKLRLAHNDFFKLKDLRDEFKIFLNQTALCLPLGVVANGWKRFRKSLLKIIVDCPVIFTSDNLYSMECNRQGEETYSYKFTLRVPSKRKPVIKLKFK